MLFWQCFRHDSLAATACATPVMLYILMDMADTPRTNEKVDFANAFLKKIALQAAGHLMREGGGHVYLKCGNSLDFSAAGVVNLRSSLSQIAGRNVSAFNHSWQSMVDSGTLSSQFSAASLVDFVVFISSIRRHRRKRFAQALAGHSLEVWERLRHGVVTFLAAVVRADVRQVVQSIPGIENRQVPSRCIARLYGWSMGMPIPPPPFRAKDVWLPWIGGGLKRYYHGGHGIGPS